RRARRIAEGDEATETGQAEQRGKEAENQAAAPAVDRQSGPDRTPSQPARLEGVAGARFEARATRSSRPLHAQPVPLGDGGGATEEEKSESGGSSGGRNLRTSGEGGARDSRSTRPARQIAVPEAEPRGEMLTTAGQL